MGRGARTVALALVHRPATGYLRRELRRVLWTESYLDAVPGRSPERERLRRLAPRPATTGGGAQWPGCPGLADLSVANVRQLPRDQRTRIHRRRRPKSDPRRQPSIYWRRRSPQ